MKISFAMPKVNWIIKELKSLTKFSFNFELWSKQRKLFLFLSAGLLSFSFWCCHTLDKVGEKSHLDSESLAWKKKLSGVEKLRRVTGFIQTLDFSFHKFMKLRFLSMIDLFFVCPDISLDSDSIKQSELFGEILMSCDRCLMKTLIFPTKTIRPQTDFTIKNRRHFEVYQKAHKSI